MDKVFALRMVENYAAVLTADIIRPAQKRALLRRRERTMVSGVIM